MKNVTKLPDHDMKAKLTDLTMEGTMRATTINDIEAGNQSKKVNIRKK